MQQSSFVQQLAVIRRQIWIILIAFASAVACALVITSQQDPVYRASTKIVVGQTGGLFQPQFSSAAQPFAQTMISLLKSNIVGRTVVENLSLPMTAEEFLAHLSVVTTAESSVLEVRFDSTERQQAVRVLTETAEVFTRLVDERLGRPADADADADTPEITANVFDPAHLEPGQVSPRPVRTTSLAAALGLALGLVFAFLRESLADSLRGRRDAEAWFGTGVIGAFPKGLTGKPPPGLANGGPARRREVSRASDMLRATVQLLASRDKAMSILVTSAARNEGKTTVAAHLAVALAAAGEEVIVVEADPYRPRLHRYLGLDISENGPVNDPRTVERSLREVPVVRASAMSAAELRSGANGQPSAHETSRDESGLEPHRAHGRLRALFAEDFAALFDRPDAVIDELRSGARFVIFDGPPIMAMGDAFPLIRTADRVLVVAREGQTRRENAALARDALERFDVGDYSVVLVDATLPGELRQS
jgi:succinoglycan biosynthesis transport protein ExoP